MVKGVEEAFECKYFYDSCNFEVHLMLLAKYTTMIIKRCYVIRSKTFQLCDH